MSKNPYRLYWYGGWGTLRKVCGGRKGFSHTTLQDAEDKAVYLLKKNPIIWIKRYDIYSSRQILIIRYDNKYILKSRIVKRVEVTDDEPSVQNRRVQIKEAKAGSS